MAEISIGRREDIDHLRCITVLLVIVYHIFYLFNTVGVISNIGVHGIPQADIIEYILYPWFMFFLFVLAGMSARISLRKRTGKEFLKQRVRTVLIPSIAGIFCFGWISGLITSQYTDMFGETGSQIPAFVKYIIYSLVGLGPLWFLHQLFLASLLLLLVRWLDKKEKLLAWGAKAGNPIALIVLGLLVWGSARILVIPNGGGWRNGFYCFAVLLGYYVFSQETVMETLVKIRKPMLAAAAVCAVAFVVRYYGTSYASNECLNSFQTNVFVWVTVLALLGCGRVLFTKETAFIRWMRPRAFAFYVFHYPVLVTSAYLLTTYTNIPIAVIYGLLAVIAVIALPILYETVSRLPVLRTLLLGISSKSHAR